MNSVYWNITSAILGILFGYSVVKLNEKGKMNRRIKKQAKKDLKIKDVDIKKQHEQKPLPVLKPCLICGKVTTGDVCSIEHQQEWIKQHTHLSEGSHEPKREEVSL